MRLTELEASSMQASRFLADGAAVDVTYRIKGVDDWRVCVFYDRDYDIILKPSFFITSLLARLSENSCLQAATAIRLLLTYSAFIGIAFEDFDRAEALGFMMFLRGTISDGVFHTFDLKTKRSEATVGAYLKHVRGYARYLRIDGSPFLEKRDLGHEYAEHIRLYGEHRLRATPAPELEAPRYISVTEFKDIIFCLDSKGDEAGRLICRLMFEHGLRIGEVLGLTIEDIKSSVSRAGELRYWVVIRNRMSDKRWMKAKNLISPSNEATYDSPEYKKRRVGCHVVFISGDLHREICDYVETEHRSPLPACKADAVDGHEGNEYVFVSKNKGPLSANAWNKRLREAMRGAGVPVDIGVRSANLNHRFRHGYAMLLTRTYGKSEYEVMTLMRHRSLKSTEVYHRPTTDDVWRMQVEVIGEIESELFGQRHESQADSANR